MGAAANGGTPGRPGAADPVVQPYDLPRAWEATTRHREAEGSSYYRHFYMGLLREDGTPKPLAGVSAKHAPAMGSCQWFDFEDHRLDEAVAVMKRLGVRYLRTGLSWADSVPPNAWLGSTGRWMRCATST